MRPCGDLPEHQPEHGIPADPAMDPRPPGLQGELLPDGGAAGHLHGHPGAAPAGPHPGPQCCNTRRPQEGGFTSPGYWTNLSRATAPRAPSWCWCSSGSSTSACVSPSCWGWWRLGHSPSATPARCHLQGHLQLLQVMSELAGYYGAVTSTVSFLLPWAVCIILAIMLLRLIQVIIHLNLVFSTIYPMH